MDTDLEQMSREQLVKGVKKLRQGIREHRDSKLHELCWHHPASWGLLPEKKYTLTHALVTGNVRWIVPPAPAFYMLTRDGDDRPHVACVVADLPDGSLMGIAFTSQGEVRLMGLPVSDRNRTKIFRQKLKGDIGVR